MEYLDLVKKELREGKDATQRVEGILSSVLQDEPYIDGTINAYLFMVARKKAQEFSNALDVILEKMEGQE